MIDLYLKFKDEAEAISVLYAHEEAPEGGLALRQRYQNIDHVGVLFEQIDPDTHVAIDGWHVNVRLVDGEDQALLEPFKIEVSSPSRVWA